MKKKIILLALLVFFLNLLWEIAHFPLYICNMENPNYVFIIINASFGDLLLISVIFALISFNNKNIKWMNKPSKFDYIIISVLGVIIAIIIELRALGAGRWSYKEIMPTIFGIGLTPLIQLVATSLVALWLLRITFPSRQQR